MMTIGSVLNVESPYSSFFTHNTHQQTAPDAQAGDSVACDKAYRFVPSAGLVTSPFRYSTSEEEEVGTRQHSVRFSPRYSPYGDTDTLKDLRKNIKEDRTDRVECLPESFETASYTGGTPNRTSSFSIIPQTTSHLPGLPESSACSITSSPPPQSSPPSGSKSNALMDGNGFNKGSFPSQQQQQRPFFDDDDDDDSWKVCGVCNDKATGYHFNALTCEGCKGFFRRSMKNSKSFTCSYNNQCSITKNNRRQCQACRLRKCIEIGMKKECIMSQDQIQLKKTLILSNRIKRATQTWTPIALNDEQEEMVEVIRCAFAESNSQPDENVIRGADELKEETKRQEPDSPASVASSNSSTYMDLIKRLSKEIAERTPSNMISETHVIHFTDIMEFSIKQVIKFCKKIPSFMDLSLQDQMALLKAGCTEILFIKANYTYDPTKRALTLGPDIMYTRESFLQGGMSETYADAYLKFHEDLSSLALNDVEMALLSAIALFSADRSDVLSSRVIEKQQEAMALALQGYTEAVRQSRNRFARIMSFLPMLRTLNSLCTDAFAQVHRVYREEIRPLVLEVQPDTNDS